MSEKKKLDGDEIVIHVPKGAAKHVRVEEADSEQPSEITVRVARNRRTTGVPVLGVIVK
ncbi:hypothetical protein WMF30_43170 [Sorangium sp. So ce134]